MLRVYFQPYNLLAFTNPPSHHGFWAQRPPKPLSSTQVSSSLTSPASISRCVLLVITIQSIDDTIVKLVRVVCQPSSQ